MSEEMDNEEDGNTQVQPALNHLLSLLVFIARAHTKATLRQGESSVQVKSKEM